MLMKEELIKDAELAKKLGYSRNRDLRKLIKRLESEGVLNNITWAIAPQVAGKRNYRHKEAWLTKSQCILLISRSGTKNAEEVIDQLVLRESVKAEEPIKEPEYLEENVKVLVAERTLLRMVANGTIESNKADSILLQLCGVNLPQEPVKQLPAPKEEGFIPPEVSVKGISPTELGEYFGISKNMVGRVISYLVKLRPDLDLRSDITLCIRFEKQVGVGIDKEMYSLTQRGAKVFTKALWCYCHSHTDLISQLHDEHKGRILR